MSKDVWHKVEEGNFEKQGKEYNYVIEQNKNIPLEKDGIRVRIIKHKPVIKTITTRYEPHVEVTGDKDAFVPSYFGYDMKNLIRWKQIVILDILMLLCVFTVFFDKQFSNFMIKINPIITISQVISRFIVYTLMLCLVLYFIFVFIVPLHVKVFEKLKIHKKLKKYGLSYKQTIN